MPKEITVQKTPGDRPDIKSLNGEIAGWIHEDKNGHPYISLEIGGRQIYPTDEDGNPPYQDQD